MQNLQSNLKHIRNCSVNWNILTLKHKQNWFAQGFLIRNLPQIQVQGVNPFAKHTIKYIPQWNTVLLRSGGRGEGLHVSMRELERQKSKQSY